jgi:2-dehydro-3-deoxygluconokinase
MTKIVTFGEVMMRLTPPGFARLTQTNAFDATFGGGEANVATSPVFPITRWVIGRPGSCATAG